MHDLTLYVGLTSTVVMFTVIVTTFEGFIKPRSK